MIRRCTGGGIRSRISLRLCRIRHRFHAKERIWDAANAVYGKGSDLAREWADRRCGALEAGCVQDVIDALERHGNADEAVKAAGYFENNRARMAYARFRRSGLCVTSGVIESGCRRIVCSRLKRGGMHWTVAGANAIMALRCSILSGRFEDFWELRAEMNWRPISKN